MPEPMTVVEYEAEASSLLYDDFAQMVAQHELRMVELHADSGLWSDGPSDDEFAQTVYGKVDALMRERERRRPDSCTNLVRGAGPS